MQALSLLSLSILFAASCLGLGAGAADAGQSVMPAPFAESWHDGLHDEPIMQVQRVDADTYVLRQSVKTNFEAPFMFLFFGHERALLMDTGAGGLKIRPTIDQLISQWMAEKGLASLQLVVAHTHSHGDHIAGDGEFSDRPNTVVVGHSPQQVAAFFHIRSWPNDIAVFDLGGRELNIIPMPGHEKAEIGLFDRHTHLLLTGDALYPGRLYIPTDPSNQFPAYRDSIDGVVNYTRSLQVWWILGNHIEMTDKPGRDYAMHTPTHPQEHVLQLPYSSLLELQKAVDAMGENARLEVHDDFIIYPLP
ncbi:MAG TPA: MBL fold metallo-hydrolase [Steroidobacteraceae bacterium]|jgi:hydroxyacylglutathione hydrolase|nr:MBL fold metallo-hydrolase [Steroidobacteraceae bacterium]